MQLTRNLETSLPAWEELCQYAQASSSTSSGQQFGREVAALKQKGPRFAYKIASWLVRAFLRDPTYAKFLGFSHADIVDLMADQVARNKAILGPKLVAFPADDVPPIAERTNTQFFRSYNQMPCTQDTAKRRVEQALRYVSRNAPILLLGDDDMVSIELAAAGFTNVTAVDIDQRVLDDIGARARADGLTVRLIQHDLAKPVPLDLYRDYALVFFDCPYTLEGVTLFLDAALDITRRRPGTLFFVSLHLMSLLREGLPQLRTLFDERNLEVGDFLQGFNVYPVPRRLKPLIHLVNRIVIGSKILATEAYTFPYFLSDAMVLKKI
jgi:SAM-dependent methyltransferase/predicted DNA-binding transcriptional regulator AlpA